MDNNVKCGVIRDLLPLVVDEVASKDSVELVNAHMETCEACRGYHEGMTAALARTSSPAPEADKVFIKLGRKIKLQTNLRKWLTRALAAVLVLIMVVSGYVFVDRKSSIYSTDMDPDWADVQLYHEMSGTVAARIEMKDGHGWYNCMETLYTDGIVYLMPMRPEWTLFNKGNANGENTFLFEYYWQDGKIVEKRHDYDNYYDPENQRWVTSDNVIERPVRTIRWGTMENYTTLYVEGEELPGVLEVMGYEERPQRISLTEIKGSDAADQTVIVQEDMDPEAAEDAVEDTPAEANGKDAGETLSGSTPENPVQGS